MSLINLNDVETFNHKFASTLVYSEVHKLWLYCEGNVGGGVIKTQYYDLETKALRKMNIRVADAKFTKDIPSIQYYNDFQRGEAAYFRRTPRRLVKQTATREGIVFNYVFWNYLPPEMQSGLSVNLPENTHDLLSIGWLINNHKQLSFEQALAKLEESDMASAAFDKQFMVSLNIETPNKFLLWYTHMQIGTVDPVTKQISINRGPFLQEVKDVLKREKCTFSVLGENKE